MSCAFQSRREPCLPRTLRTSGHSEGPLSFRSEHAEQTTKNGSPSHESHQHGPATYPTIVSAYDCKAGNKQEDADEISDRSNVGSPDVKIHCFGYSDRCKGGSKQSCDFF